ncbi:putative ABC transporter membrane-spanning permease domain protein [Vibrio parahaemolyticus EKP-028]|nr:putative ABC transporter membrane-spanning permease domain protein [Vibrio parahaemolyticus EKP-028]
MVQLKTTNQSRYDLHGGDCGDSDCCDQQACFGHTTVLVSVLTRDNHKNGMPMHPIFLSRLWLSLLSSEH